MDKTTFKKQVREFVGEAETEKALDLMLSFLGRQSAYLNLYNQTLQAKSLFNKTERDENQGVISKEDAKISYNQVVKQIIQIINDLDKEEQAGQGKTSKMRRNLIAGLVLLMLMSGAGYIIWKVRLQPGTNGNGPISGIFCPDYNSMDANAFKVLILPFRIRTIGDSIQVDRSIAEDIEERLDKFKIDYKVNLGLGVKDIIEEYPNTTTEADQVARSCAANLIIWGAREQDIVTTRYKFINIEEFKMKQLVLAANSSIDTLTSQTSIVATGLLTEGIEEVMKYIFGIIAHETGNQDAAIAALSGVRLSDAIMDANKDMFLADALLQKGDTQAAKQKYTEVLEKKPDYWLARTNRAALNFKDREFLKAAQDFTIQESTGDTSRVEAVRGEALSLLKAGNLEEAKEKLDRIAVKDTSVHRLVDSINTEIRAKEAIRPRPDDAKIRPKSPEADLPKKAKEPDLSEVELRRLIQKDPQKKEYWSELLIRLYKKKDFEGLRQLAQKAKEMGIEENFYENPIAEWLKNDAKRKIIQ